MKIGLAPGGRETKGSAHLRVLNAFKAVVYMNSVECKLRYFSQSL